MGMGEVIERLLNFLGVLAKVAVVLIIGAIVVSLMCR
jgi:hypothetical protein